jgi:mannose-6-phosphate isomerase-like protein (cupin superfamily)
MKHTGNHITRNMLEALIREAADGRPVQGVLVEALRHGTMSLEYYLPSREDRQQPHDQDELYIVQKGSSTFELEDTVMELEAGDAVFVPAGARHRFRSFSAGFATWAIFWGRKGGEAP